MNKTYRKTSYWGVINSIWPIKPYSFFTFFNNQITYLTVIFNSCPIFFKVLCIKVLNQSLITVFSYYQYSFINLIPQCICHLIEMSVNFRLVSLKLKCKFIKLIFQTFIPKKSTCNFILIVMLIDFYHILHLKRLLTNVMFSLSSVLSSHVVIRLSPYKTK